MWKVGGVTSKSSSSRLSFTSLSNFNNKNSSKNTPNSRNLYIVPKTRTNLKFKYTPRTLTSDRSCSDSLNNCNPCRTFTTKSINYYKNGHLTSANLNANSSASVSDVNKDKCLKINYCSMNPLPVSVRSASLLHFVRNFSTSSSFSVQRRNSKDSAGGVLTSSSSSTSNNNNSSINQSETNCKNKSVERGFASYSIPIPGTSAAAAAAGLIEGTVVERQVWIENETFRREELRSRDLRRRSSLEPSMVWSKLGVPSAGSSTRSRISSQEVGGIAQEVLGSERFNTSLSLSHNFGPFQDIICLFLFKVSHIDHPLLHITKIIEQEPSQNLREVRKNPYPLWRAMMVLLTAEMYGFPKDISQAPPEIHWAIKDKHNRVSKIAEIAWITHQLHRRILDISSINPTRLSCSSPEEQMKLLENLHKANKATTLVGDLLLTQKCAHLAALKSPPTTELICNSLADFCESEFELGVKSGQPRHFKYESWLSRCELGLGSLLGHCMYSALLFSGFDTATRNQAFKLGSILGILYQAYDDISFFQREELTNPSWMDVGILPSVYEIQRNPDLLLKPHAEIFHAVKSSPLAMEESMETFYFLKEHALKALAVYEDVDNTIARDILINFIHSLSPLKETTI